MTGFISDTETTIITETTLAALEDQGYDVIA